MEFGRTTDINPLHSLNSFLPMKVTESDMATDVSFVHLTKAHLSMVLTVMVCLPIIFVWVPDETRHFFVK